MSYINRCGECNAVMDDDALFCSKCGAKAQMACYQCGSAIADSDLFCRRCGTSLNSFQAIPEEALVNVAKSVAHRINNALSIILANSQLATRGTANPSQMTGRELQQYLQDIEVAAEGGGNVIRQFQRFLDSIANGHPQGESSVYAEQIVSNLSVPANPEPPVSYVIAESKKAALVGRVSILIIDDEDKIRHALSYALSLGGHHVITASDGQEALNLMHSGSYDIAFVDLKMPGMNGWEISSAIKKIDPDTMVVLMTGWNIRQDDERLRINHIDAMIAKPFELSQINDMVTAVGNNDRL